MEEKNSYFRRFIIFLIFPFYIVARKYTKGFDRTFDILVFVNMLYIAAVVLLAVYYLIKSALFIVYG